jgi:hypothetical protein
MRAFLSACSGVLLAAGAVLWLVSPARADGAWIEVNPSTIQAGYRIELRASCGDNVNTATVKSSAFSEVTLSPQNGFLVGAVTVPTGTRARTYSVRLSCANGSSASTTLNVIDMSTPSRGPATGGGGTAGEGDGGLLLAGGLTAVALGAGLGVVALRRRRPA